MKRIYIAAPFKTGDVHQNTKNAIQIASMLIDLGYSVYCPQLVIHVESISSKPYSVIANVNASFIHSSDAVLRLFGESETADNNVVMAGILNIPVFTNFSELVAAINPYEAPAPVVEPVIAPAPEPAPESTPVEAPIIEPAPEAQIVTDHSANPVTPA